MSDTSRTAVSGECEVCGQLRPVHVAPIPAYDSDDSPRALLNEVVAKVHPPGGCACQYGENSFCALQVDATAAQICEVIVAAHKAGPAKSGEGGR